MAAKHKVFLGGTCNNTTWREKLIPDLTIDYFNPVVEEWTPEDQKKEEDEKENKCDIHLYVITSAMKGVFSIAEAVDSVHNPKVDTILHVMPEGFDDRELKSLKAVVDLINKRGGKAYIIDNLEVTSKILSYSYA